MNKDPKAVKQKPAAKQGLVKVELAKKEEEIVIELSKKQKAQKNRAILAIVFLVILLVLPPLLRGLDVSYKPKQVKRVRATEVDVHTLFCNSHTEEEDYKSIIEVTGKYVDSHVVQTKIVYNFTDKENNLKADLDPETLDLSEYNKISALKSKAVTATKETNTYTIDINYEEDGDLLENALLKNYVHDLMQQKKYFENNEASCSLQKQSSVVINKEVWVDKR